MYTVVYILSHIFLSHIFLTACSEQEWLLRDRALTSDDAAADDEKLNDVDLKAGSKETFLIQVRRVSPNLTDYMYF